MRRLLLDTRILALAERCPDRVATFLRSDDDIVVAAITVAALQWTSDTAPDVHRVRRNDFLRALLAAVPVEPYTSDTARAHANLQACTRSQQHMASTHDLMIAATALTTGRTLVTTAGASLFEELPGVRTATIPQSP